MLQQSLMRCGMISHRLDGERIKQCLILDFSRLYNVFQCVRILFYLRHQMTWPFSEQFAPFKVAIRGSFTPFGYTI